MSISDTGSRGEQTQALIEPRDEPVQSERRDACGGELDRQRHAIEGATQITDLLAVERVVPSGGDGPFDEQRHRITALGGDRQAGHGVHPLERSHEAGTAGGDERERRTRRQQALGARTHRVDQVLAVVEDDHRVGSGERSNDGVVERTAGLLGDADRRGDRGDDHARVGHVDQIDEPAAVASSRRDVLRHVQRQARLAHATGSGHRHHAVRGDRGDQLLALTRPSDEGGDGHRPAGTLCDRRPPRARRSAGQTAAVGDLHLAHQRRHVTLDGALRHAQLVGDLPVREVPGDEPPHLALALGDQGRA